MREFVVDLFVIQESYIYVYMRFLIKHIIKMRGINRKLHSFQNPLESRIHVLQAISARCMIFLKQQIIDRKVTLRQIGMLPQ